MDNQRKWRAIRYRYGNNQEMNPGRWEIFAPNDEGHLISVGGVFKVHGRDSYVAFLCRKLDQEFIRRPSDAEARCQECLSWGRSVLEACSRLKFKHPHPFQTLAQNIELQKALF